VERNIKVNVELAPPEVKPSAPFDPRCERCGRVLKPGDWPYCNDHPGDHDGAIHYGWTWGGKSL
jgi:hypothetical protein